MDGDGTKRRARRNAGSILIFLPVSAVIVSSILKFAGVPGVGHQMTAAGFSERKLTLVAALEISSAVLFLYPRTRSFGVLMLSSVLGGAICTHVQMGEYTKGIPPSMLLTLAWVGIWLRHPQAFWSLNPGRAGTTQGAEANRESWVPEST